MKSQSECKGLTRSRKLRFWKPKEAPKGRHELIREAHPNPRRQVEQDHPQNPSGSRKKRNGNEKKHRPQGPQNKHSQGQDARSIKPKGIRMHRIEMTIESEPKRPNTYPNTTSPTFSASKFPFETQTERGPKDQSWMGIGTGDGKSYKA